MRNPFHRFDAVYCINLDSRSDRWEECLKEFSKFDIPHVQRFSGILFDSLKIEKLDKVALGRLGCALSFYRIIREAYNNNKLSVLILEDDFLLINPVDVTLTELTKQIDDLPKDWDMLYLGANLHESYGFPIEKHSQYLHKVNCAYALHSVAFSQKGMSKFLNSFTSELGFMEKILFNYGAIDIFFAKDFLKKNNCYIGNTFLCGQRPSTSNIEGWECNYTPSMLARFLHYTRLI